MMHMRSNNSYDISGFAYDHVISSFTNFVYLFMTVSAFGMCCGYYKRMLEDKANLTDFYSKRFKKILPFFGALVLLDVVISPSLNALYEAFADLTLLFGFLPDAGNITVIGVGWFLGLVFVFYICFPFFCVLLQNKRRAWMAFAVSLIYNFVCDSYFDVERNNILYSSCYFLEGGLIYLYRDKIESLNRWFGLGVVAASVALYYAAGFNIFTMLLVSAALLSYVTICVGGMQKSYILENRITKFISNISMEVYLSHMVIFRLVEKVGLNRMFGTGWMQYTITVLLVLTGTIIFSAVMQKVIKITEKKIDGVRVNINI